MRQILQYLAKLIDYARESAHVSIAVGRDGMLYYAASLALEWRLRPLL